MSTATDVQHKSIYDFKANDIDGHEISFDKYRGKVLLVVNVASNCGTTEFNYSQLKQLYDKYKGKGFAVAAFPCNQFGGQVGRVGTVGLKNRHFELALSFRENRRQWVQRASVVRLSEERAARHTHRRHQMELHQGKGKAHHNKMSGRSAK